MTTTDSSVVVTAASTIPGDEIPPAARRTLPGDEPPAVGPLVGDDPPIWVKPVDPRDAPIAHLLQPPVIRSVGGPKAQLHIPPLSGLDLAWMPEGQWFTVRCDTYRRMVGDRAMQAGPGDRVQLVDDERTADDIARRYLIRED